MVLALVYVWGPLTVITSSFYAIELTEPWWKLVSYSQQTV